MTPTTIFAALISLAAFCSPVVAEQPNLASAQNFLESYRKASPSERQYLEDQAFAVTVGIAAADEKSGTGLMCPHGINLTGELLIAILQVYLTTKPDYGTLPWSKALLEAVVAKYPCRI
jgi:hypothetical protein